MKTSVSAKRCPECGRVSALQAPHCLDCGHRFRTQFAEPDDRTQAFDAVLLPRPPALSKRATTRARRSPVPSAFLFAFLGSFCLVAILGGLGWLGWDLSQNAAPPPASAAVFAGPPIRRAADLYEHISLSMSLYDLDQTAGGMGRVILSPDPRVFLLSYDFPSAGPAGQSVHVMLTRPDLSDTDYRVQAVALYHGNTLVQRHADDY